MRWADRLREVLSQRTDAFFSLEDAVLVGEDPEAIHDMRVASRRLQEVLRLVFPDEPRLPELIRVIRRARRVQSGVRDLDVMAGHLNDMARGAGADARKALRFARRATGVRRKRRCEKMAGALKALDLAGLRADLEGLMAPGAGEDPVPGRVRAQVALRAQAGIAERADAFQKAVSAARSSLESEDLHLARIAGKRLRYILETSGELGMGSFRRRIAQMREIQQTLGHWHDLEVLEETVTGLLADREVFRRRLPLVRAGCELIAGWRTQKAAHVEAFLKLTEGGPGAPEEGAPGPSRRAKP
jgi:CHAD domain-containing protein